MSTGVIDTGTDHLLADLTGGILTLTFNRPEARNALSSELLQALGSQLADGEINPEVRCVVITGTGAAFCAGGDVKAMSETNSNGVKSTLDTLIQRQRLNQRATSGRLYKMPKPTLAVLSGPDTVLPPSKRSRLPPLWRDVNQITCRLSWRLLKPSSNPSSTLPKCRPRRTARHP